jgi:hypothetical protein
LEPRSHQRPRYWHGARGAAESAAAGGERIVNDAGAAASGAAATAREAVAGAVASAGSMASAAIDRTREGAAAGVADAKNLVEEGKAPVQKAVQGAQHQVTQGTDALTQFAEEQPILVAALGAAIGAALPIIEAERRYLGAGGHRVAGVGKQVVTRVADATTEQVAGTDVGVAVDKASRGNLE